MFLRLGVKFSHNQNSMKILPNKANALFLNESNSVIGNANQTLSSFPIPTPINLIIAIFLSFFTVLTICGNFLVIFAVLKERYLRSITNYFIVSLATADLFMGTLVMPFAVIQVVGDGYWPFGQYWCDFWHAFDVLSSTGSILNLCMIALERYWATENPINYSSRMTKFRCFLMILLVWVCSSAISFPAILWWRVVLPHNPSAYKCEFTSDRLYLISSSFVSFYGPLIVMLVVYYRIYRTATDLVRSLNEGTKVIYKNGHHGEVMVLRIHRGVMPDMSGKAGHNVFNSCQKIASTTDSEGECSTLASPGNPSSAGVAINFQRDPSAQSLLDHHQLNNFTEIENRRNSVNENDDNATKSIARKLRNFAVGKRLSKFAREQKAAKTLGIVMGIFIICWLPFFLCNIIQAVDQSAFDGSKLNAIIAVTWLGYINSSINPMIYAHSMKDFRRAFIKLLCSCCLVHQRQSYPVEKAQMRVAAMAIASSVTVRPRLPHHSELNRYSSPHTLSGTVLSLDNFVPRS